MNQPKWITVLRRSLITIGIVMFIINAFIVAPETTSTIWINRLGGLFLFCGVIVGGGEAYLKKHIIVASILFVIGFTMIFDFVLLKLWINMF